MMVERVALSASELLDVLDELESMFSNAKPVLMSRDVRMDKQAALDLIDELRRGLPSAVERSDELLRQARRELEDARRSGEETIAVARQRALELVEQEQVVIQANARAADIVTQAETHAATLRGDADEYCDGRLAAFQEDLDVIAAQVTAGRQRLADRLGPGAGRPRWTQVQEPQWPEAEAS
jgi:F0F1-type ATP synthase membrane subunit b/b'